MISPDVLRKGLAALGEAYSRKTDSGTEKLWGHALRELSDAQYRFGVDLVIRDSGVRFFPPPGVVLAAGFSMPRDSVATFRKLPPIRHGDFWADGNEQEKYLQAVRDNPIIEPESTSGIDGVMHYLRRLCVASGTMTEDGDTPVKAMPSEREPGEEG